METEAEFCREKLFHKLWRQKLSQVPIIKDAEASAFGPAALRIACGSKKGEFRP